MTVTIITTTTTENYFTDLWKKICLNIMIAANDLANAPGQFLIPVWLGKQARVQGNK